MTPATLRHNIQGEYLYCPGMSDALKDLLGNAAFAVPSTTSKARRLFILTRCKVDLGRKHVQTYSAAMTEITL